VSQWLRQRQTLWHHPRLRRSRSRRKLSPKRTTSPSPKN